MSLTALRPYYKARGEAVGLTYHNDAFNVDNIASNILDKSFAIGITSFSGIKLNQHDQEISAPVEIVLYVKGYRSVNEGLDKAILLTENLIKEVEAPANRLGTSIKNVTLSNCSIEPLATNDNVIFVKIVFNNIITLGL